MDRGSVELVLVGAGNIGSHLVPHLARDIEVGRVTIVDRDRYEAHNLVNQDIVPADLGRAKASVQRRRALRIAPGLATEAVVDDVERLPWGRLRADAILTCLDSRRARQWVNLVSRRLGITWLDAGVGGGSNLVRVSVFPPGRDEPCLECAWDQRDYELVEQRYPCAGDGAQDTPSTGGTSELGALAASLLAVTLRRVRSGGHVHRQDLHLDVASGVCQVTAYSRNPGCRLGDHRPWRVEPLGAGPGEVTVYDAFLLLGERLAVARSPFVVGDVCTACGRRRSTLRLASRRGRPCAACGGATMPPGTAVVDEIRRDKIPRRQSGRLLASIGLEAGDVISGWSEDEVRHRELA